MFSGDMEKLYPSTKTLVKEHIPSRINAKDASIYDFSEAAQESAQNFMGWADLGSHAQCDVDALVKFADEVAEDGFETVVLVGQGGSTQAPMTMTKYNKLNGNRLNFRVMDSDSPVRMRELFAACKPETTLVIVASKSGGTLEPRMALAAIREEFEKTLGADMPKHLVAITDPGSGLEAQAKKEGWRAIFSGEPTVGGRFSALSVFGLLPAALVGIDMKAFMQHALEAEKRCSEDAIDNPAVNLAAFMYDNYVEGRNKLAFLVPKRGRAFGLWIEQLVAESLGKDGEGILPIIEVDPLLLYEDTGDHTVVTYLTETKTWDETSNFEMGISYIDDATPRMGYKLESVEDLADHFIMWEYATAMCGYLMRICPFDQPDVASAKAVVLDILRDGMPEPDYTQQFSLEIDMGTVEVRASDAVKPELVDGEQPELLDSLYALLDSVGPGDYFAMNCFLPFTGEGRREALESMRRSIAESFGVMGCLEVGPRYLHSTGQLQKGGTNCGVFLILSAEELKDIPLPEGCEAPSMGTLGKAQAVGDFVTLASRDRRVVHLHLPDNTAATLREMAHQLDEAIARVMVDDHLNILNILDEVLEEGDDE